MKLIDSKARFSRFPVTMHDGDEITSEHIFGTKLSAHVLRKNFPRGVIPIAIMASASITTPKGNFADVRTCGIGFTEEDARKDAKRKLRKKLCGVAKKHKFLITLSGDGYIIRSPMMGNEILYGHGSTLEEAHNNFGDNLKAIEKLLDEPKPSFELISTRRSAARKEMQNGTMSLKTFKVWEKDQFDPAKKPTRKWKWYHWFYLPPL